MDSFETRLRLHPPKNVEVVGFAENIVDEYRRTDVFLVTVPVEQGFRTRIAEAFSYGMCVVAHSANCAGMPEVIDGNNALTAADPDELCARLVSAGVNVTERQRLGAAARATPARRGAATRRNSHGKTCTDSRDLDL